MEIKLQSPKISMHLTRDMAFIEIIDSQSSTTFVKVKLDPNYFLSMLSGLSYTECEATVYDLDRIGKTMQHKVFEFEIKRTDKQSDLELDCVEFLFENGMYEWLPDHYYNSQNTFFEKDGRKYARTTIRRWV